MKKYAISFDEEAQVYVVKDTETGRTPSIPGGIQTKREAELLVDFLKADDAAARLKAENERMRKALLPFALIADILDFFVPEACPGPDDLTFPKADVRIEDGPGRIVLEEADFIRARDALKGEGE